MIGAIGNRQIWMAGFWLVAVLAVCLASTRMASNSLAQEESLDPEIDEFAPAIDGPATEATSRAAAATEEKNLFDTLLAAGWFWLLLFVLLSLIAVAFIIEHAMTIRKSRLIPDFVIGELEEKISRGEWNEAVAFCHQPENYSLATEVVLAGLERYQGSDFGFAEYKTAIEEAGEDQTSRLYRKTEVLGVIGAIAPMLGLTGTVWGMIKAFDKINTLDRVASSKDLAGEIGTALVTTLLGLVIAIPTMIAYSFFRNKIDSIVGEAGKRIERITMPLGRKR